MYIEYNENQDGKNFFLASVGAWAYLLSPNVLRGFLSALICALGCLYSMSLKLDVG